MRKPPRVVSASLSISISAAVADPFFHSPPVRLRMTCACAGTCLVVEYEQHGADHARYGTKPLTQLSADLTERRLRGCVNFIEPILSWDG